MYLSGESRPSLAYGEVGFDDMAVYLSGESRPSLAGRAHRQADSRVYLSGESRPSLAMFRPLATDVRQCT